MISDEIVEILAKNAAGKLPIMKAYRDIVKEVTDLIKDRVTQDREGEDAEFEKGFNACEALVDEACEDLNLEN